MLLWIDLETTGLDPRRDAILEIALVVTDNRLNEVHAESHVLPYNPSGPHQPNDYVHDMHTRNGLWTACADALQASEQGVGDDASEIYIKVLESMRRYTEQGTAPIAGSTVDFDRNFLREHAPALAAHFSHRRLDVSVLGELAARWAPELWANRPKGDAHRALPDIRGSIDLLRYWVANGFVNAGGAL